MKNDESGMKGCLWFLLLIFVVVVYRGVTYTPGRGSSSSASSSYSSPSSGSSAIDKIIAAKNIVRTSVVNHPDTLDFHDWTYSPIINGDTVTLKFSCQNAFGVQETHTMDIEVR